MFVIRATTIAILIAAMAGCLADNNEPSEATNEPMPPTDGNTLPLLDLTWGLSDCQATVVFFDVDASEVQPHLPEGFTPLPLAQGLAGGGPNPTEGGSFGIEMFTCASGQGLHSEVAPIVYGSYFAFVDPPNDLEQDVDFHFVKWDTVVPDEPLRLLLQQYGLPVFNGTASYSAFDLTQAFGSTAGNMDMGGATHAFSGTAVAPGPPAVTFVEFMQGNDTLVAWYTSATTTDSGQGTATVDVPEGTLAAQVLGAGSHDGSLLQFRGNFQDGSIRTVR